MVGLSRSVWSLTVRLSIYDPTGDDKRVLGGSLSVIAATLAIKVGTDLDLQGSNITEACIYSGVCTTH
jgi:hypothetical protein